MARDIVGDGPEPLQLTGKVQVKVKAKVKRKTSLPLIPSSVLNLNLLEEAPVARADSG